MKTIIQNSHTTIVEELQLKIQIHEKNTQGRFGFQGIRFQAGRGKETIIDLK